VERAAYIEGFAVIHAVATLSPRATSARASQLHTPGTGALQAHLATTSAMNTSTAPNCSEAVLTIDVGSSSIKAMLFDPRACTAPLPWSMVDVPSSPTLSAPAILERIDQVATAVQLRISQRAIDAPPVVVVAIGFACFSMSLLGLDAAGAPVTEVFSYATTTPPVALHLPLAASARRTGVFDEMLPCYALPHIAAHRGVAMWTTIPSFVIEQWTGRANLALISLSEASWWVRFSRRSTAFIMCTGRVRVHAER